MPTESFRLGRKAVAYYNDTETIFASTLSGSGKSGRLETWLGFSSDVTFGSTLKATNLTDVSLNLNSEYADGTTRETAEAGFASPIPVLRGGEVTFEARWKPGDPAATSSLSFTEVLMNAWQTDGVIAMAFLDKNWPLVDYTTGEEFICTGLAANFNVSMSKSEPLRDLQRMSISLTIADEHALWYVSSIRTGTG